MGGSPDDINEASRAAWKAETTTQQRVRAVVSTEYDGLTAGETATEALVSETTARRHLEALADQGFVEKTAAPDSGATRYRRSWESLVFEQARDMLRNTDSSTLFAKVNEMQDELEAYREETGLESPEDVAWNEGDIDRELLWDWRSTRRNLSFAKVALALDQAGDVVGEPNQGSA
ncbi:DUF7342 family protein [Natronolimnohabitans innermongolicus]|uniref:Transcriptional regulator n=1 Tax=Natronolimnohabitans innermongolicus JCM 12255 TaxID=1227499 RepID=L9WS84_9EURY|nr:hypothetical protein [Natronolimnohabitans innermongolicus]ELY51168.1 transcriptional regulator [Natronolimnohabitans innermongolicus JCM 12255]